MTESVVLVHGLFMRGEAMLPLAVQLRHGGYQTHLFTYPTLAQSPRENARALKRLADEIETPVIHFVGHSLGWCCGISFTAVRPGRPAASSHWERRTSTVRRRACWPASISPARY